MAEPDLPSIDALVRMVMRIICMPTADSVHSPRPRGPELPKAPDDQARIRRHQDELIEAED